MEKERRYIAPENKDENSGWEDFGEEYIGGRLINDYDGAYTDRLRLNRKALESLIQTQAGMNGGILLTTLADSRFRGLEANPDGSVSRKKNLFWGQKVNEEENPDYKVVQEPRGWIIKINDQKIIRELQEKNVGAQFIPKRFAAKLNNTLKTALMETIVNEKLNINKNPRLKGKYLWTAWFASHPYLFDAMTGDIGKDEIPMNTVLSFTSIALFNAMIEIMGRSSGVPPEFMNNRRIREAWDVLLPPIEADRVARAQIFLSTKGRKLVDIKTQNSTTTTQA